MQDSFSQAWLKGHHTSDKIADKYLPSHYWAQSNASNYSRIEHVSDRRSMRPAVLVNH